jgi:hypothetical protein
MADTPIEFDFSDDIHESVIDEVKAVATRKVGADVVVAPGHVALHLVGPADISAWGGFIVSIILLVIEMRRDTADRKWDYDRIKSVIRTHMMSLDIHRFEIESIENFKALLEGSGGSCKAVLRDAQQSQYTLYIAKTGEVKYSISQGKQSSALPA